MNWQRCLLALVSFVPCVHAEQATEEEWALRDRLRQEVRDMELRRNALVDQIRIREEAAETLSTAALLMTGEMESPPAPAEESLVLCAAYETENPCVLVGNGKHNCRHLWMNLREGARYRCLASVRAEDVRGVKGVKFGMMLARADGQRDWPSARLGAGTYDWMDVAFEFAAPAGCRKGMLLYGLEGGEGRVEFKDVRIMEIGAGKPAPAWRNRWDTNALFRVPAVYPRPDMDKDGVRAVRTQWGQAPNNTVNRYSAAVCDG